jgi:hypothetical protein
MTQTGLVEGTIIGVKETFIRIKFDRYGCRPHIGMSICDGNNEIAFPLSREGAALLIEELRELFDS